MVPLQHNILLQAIDIQQINAIQSFINLRVINEGTSASPADVVVSLYTTTSPDFSSAAVYVGNFTLSPMQSTDMYPIDIYAVESKFFYYWKIHKPVTMEYY